MGSIERNYHTSLDKNEWACKNCTYLNPISTYPKCDMCDETDQQSLNTSSNLVNTYESLSTTSISLAVYDRQHNDETNAEKIFRDIISYCQKAKIHFVDDQFTPSSRSIGNIDDSLQWLRISQISSSSETDQNSPWSVYSSPKPSDIQQGALGDCWLMAALALITERPEMLEHILLTKIVNNEGVYLVRICHNGLWKTVLLDDCFPCTKYKQLAYTQANGCQLYVPLIEKACAKLFSSYADLIGGHIEEGLQLLTGAPCDHIDLNPSSYILDRNIIWAKLLSACESQLLIGASTGRTDVSEEEYKRVHINQNHAFSILAAYSISDISMQFILVRDPHARVDYREELITPFILAQLNSILSFPLPSGAFWISLPAFLRFFNYITISTYASDYYDIREVAQFTRSATELIPAFHFHVSNTTLINISLLYHRKNRRSPIYHTQSFVLCNVEDGIVKNVGKYEAILKTHRGAYTDWKGSLRAGNYVLIPFSTSFWEEKNYTSERNYTLVIHSKIPIDVRVIPEPATLLADCLIATIIKENPNISEDEHSKYYKTPKDWHFIMLIAENLSTSDYLNIDIDMSDAVHIRNSRQSFITHDCIPPRHRQIIFLTEWTQEQNQTAIMQYTINKSSHVKQSDNSVPAIHISRNDFHSFRPF